MHDIMESSGAENDSSPATHTNATQQTGYAQLFTHISSATTLEAFYEILTLNDHLLDPTLLQDFRMRMRSPSILFGPCFLRFTDVLELATDDAESAWALILSSRERRDIVEGEIQGEISVVQRLHNMGGALSSASISLANQALVKALDFVELRGYVKVLLECKAKALYHIRGGNRAQTLEDALSATQFALQQYPGDIELLLHLAVIFSDRILGDHLTNQKNSIDALRAALEAHDPIEPSTSPFLKNRKALTHTNLAVALMRLYSSDGVDRDERISGLLEAVEHCEVALTIRSPDINLIDWAYSQINLAEVTEKLVDVAQKDVTDVELACQAIIDRKALFDDPGSAHFVARALEILGSTIMRHARSIIKSAAPQETHYLLSELMSSPSPPRAVLLRARQLFEDAYVWVAKGQDDSLHARIANSLFDVLLDLHDDDETIRFGDKQIHLINKRNMLNASTRCRFGDALGYLHASRKEWDQAVPGYRVALDACNDAVYTASKDGLDPDVRKLDQSKKLRLHRWAAYVFAASGDPEAAMLALENGRARELRHRFLSTDISNDSEDSLEDLPKPLKTTYLSALDTSKHSPLMDSGADSSASRALHTVINLIRKVPGHRNFMTGVKVSDVAPAIEDGWPLLYVNPTPFGTLLLFVQRRPGDGEGTPEMLRYSCRLLEETKSGEITLKCQVGHAAKISNYRNWRFIHDGDRVATLPQSLEGVLRWLGNRVARHIHTLVADATKDTVRPNPVGLTIVACGHISMMPIDAASWKSSNSSTSELQCLSNTFIVRYAPSAVIFASCARKARVLDHPTTIPQPPPTFVAVGNPLDNLPQSHSEIKEIEAHFPSGARHTAFESHATISFVTTHAPAATYLHFATHAQANYLPTLYSDLESQACVQLADGALLATHIPSMLSLTRNRLTVISACETVVRGIDLPDEAFSIGSVILASGSACVVGSMWKVDDHATGLLMVRMYEEMLENGRRPPEALREAKMWLRGLDMDGVQEEFFERHEGLADGIRENGYFDGKPFEHPFFWAGFVAVGI